MGIWLLPLPSVTAKGTQGSPAHAMLASRDMAMEKDFRALRSKLEQAGLFKANGWFYVALLVHVLLLELAGWAVLKYVGTGWLPYTIAVCLLVTAQVLPLAFLCLILRLSTEIETGPLSLLEEDGRYAGPCSLSLSLSLSLCLSVCLCVCVCVCLCAECARNEGQREWQRVRQCMV